MFGVDVGWRRRLESREIKRTRPDATRRAYPRSRETDPCWWTRDKIYNSSLKYHLGDPDLPCTCAQRHIRGFFPAACVNDAPKDNRTRGRGCRAADLTYRPPPRQLDHLPRRSRRRPCTHRSSRGQTWVGRGQVLAENIISTMGRSDTHVFHHRWQQSTREN